MIKNKWNSFELNVVITSADLGPALSRWVSFEEDFKRLSPTAVRKTLTVSHISLWQQQAHFSTFFHFLPPWKRRQRDTFVASAFRAALLETPIWPHVFVWIYGSALAFKWASSLRFVWFSPAAWTEHLNLQLCLATTPPPPLVFLRCKRHNTETCTSLLFISHSVKNKQVPNVCGGRSAHMLFVFVFMTSCGTSTCTTAPPTPPTCCQGPVESSSIWIWSITFLKAAGTTAASIGLCVILQLVGVTFGLNIHWDPNWYACKGYKKVCVCPATHFPMTWGLLTHRLHTRPTCTLVVPSDTVIHCCLFFFLFFLVSRRLYWCPSLSENQLNRQTQSFLKE